MLIPTEIAILNALSDDDETIDSGIRNELSFFKIDISYEMLIKTLNNMLENQLISIAHVHEDESKDEILRTWFRRTDKGTKIWNDFSWREYEDYISERHFELFGECK